MSPSTRKPRGGRRQPGSRRPRVGARLRRPRLWADDRIHLNGEGHRRVAEAVGQAIGLAPRFEWQAPLPPLGHATWTEQRLADAKWARVHLLPWIGRRLTGSSSGDGLPAKRPTLAPLHVDITDVGGSS